MADLRQWFLNKIITSGSNNPFIKFSDFASPNSQIGVTFNLSSSSKTFLSQSLSANSLSYNNNTIELNKIFSDTTVPLFFGKSSEFQINTYSTSDQYDPEIASLSNGNSIIIWRSFNQDGSGHGIYGQIYDKDGSKVGNEFQIHTRTDSGQENGVVTGLNNGNLL